jgi:SPP1 gp7 family putative phage head morphogenesis protein
MVTRKLLEQIRRRRKLRAPARKPVPRQLEPNTIALAYFAALHKVVSSARRRIQEQLLPLLPELTARAAERRGDSAFERYGYHTITSLGGKVTALDAMDPGRRVNKMLDRVSESFYKEWKPDRLTDLARKYAERTSDFQRTQLAGQIRSQLGIDPVIAEPGLAQRVKDFTAENVALIKSIPQQMFDQIEQKVISGIRNGERHEEIAKQIQERFAVSESRAKLIARDQTLKFYGELNRARQQAMGVSRYVWRTSNDQRVRDAHGEFDGNTYSWDDPPGDGSAEEGTHPGTAINCRCSAEPVLDDLFAEMEVEPEEAPSEPENEPEEPREESTGRGKAADYTPGEGKVATGPDDAYWVPLKTLEDLFAKARDPGRTADIVKGFAQGKPLPPIVVGMDSTNGGRAITDGMHRLAAARAEGRSHLRVRFTDEMAHERGALVEQGKVTEEVRREALIELRRESYKGTEWEKTWKDLPENRPLFDGSPLPAATDRWY